MPALSLAVFVATLVVLGLLVAGGRGMENLAAVPSDIPDQPPLVSIIVAACNEEATLEPALRSLLGQEYPNLEIIVIDDRSTDNTWQLLQRIAVEFPHLKLHKIERLPEGWLGKNHALYTGAGMADGEILLFTDADIVMERTTLSRAVNFLVRHRADHLSLVFRNITRGALLNGMIVDALGGLFLLLRPWAVGRKNSRAFIGIGAFNMLTASAYRRLGGHGDLKMHPIDDVMLGRKVKQAGMRQYCLLGGDFVTVRWYGSVREMVNGLMKNIFAMYGYRIGYAAAGVAGIVTMTIVPAWGVVLCRGWAKLFFGLAVLGRLLIFTVNSRLMKVNLRSLPFSLLTPYLIVYIIFRAVWTTLKQQGIEWRGTRYPLCELKKQEPLFSIFR